MWIKCKPKFTEIWSDSPCFIEPVPGLPGLVPCLQLTRPGHTQGACAITDAGAAPGDYCDYCDIVSLSISVARPGAVTEVKEHDFI